MTNVAPEQRYNRGRPCPICGGYDNAPRGQGVRCYGYLSTDGTYARCTREEYAGPLEREGESDAYPHRLEGKCHCGKEHGTVSSAHTPTTQFDLWRYDRAYDYLSESGDLLFQVLRYSHPSKTFRQRRPLVADPDPKERKHWAWNLQGVSPVLYRLPELTQSQPDGVVFIVEGEKDVDRLRDLGLTATTNPMGAGKWRPAYAQWLKGRRIVVLADNDQEGRKHAAQVESALRNTVQRVSVIELSGIPEHGDVSDWLDQGGKIESLLWRTGATDVEEYGLADLLKAEFPPLQWIVPDILPEGLTMIVGKAKLGKSLMVIGLCIAVGAGGVALGTLPVQGGHVLYIALEDGWRRLQTRALKIVNGTSSTASNKLRFRRRWPRMDEGGLEMLEEWLDANPDTKLVVVDTFTRFRPLQRGQHAFGEDYSSLTPLQDMAERRRIAVLVVHHTTKIEPDDPLDAANGTLGLSAAVDGYMLLKRKRGENTATLHVTQRDGDEGDKEFALQFDPLIGTWRIAGQGEDFRVTKERCDILKVINEAVESVRPAEIAELLGIPAATVKMRLSRMVKDKQIRVVRYGQYGPVASRQSASDDELF